MIQYSVYILESETNGSYYIGSTGNLNQRLIYHNSGKVKSTSAGTPWILKYKEYYSNLNEARKREVQLKGWKKRKAIERLINHDPIV